MDSSFRRSSRSGRFRRTRRAVVAVLLVAATCLASVTSVTPTAEAQTPPTPPRPLILIGATFIPNDFQGANGVPSWDDVAQWLHEEGGYTRDQNLFIWELKRQPRDTPPPLWSARPDVLGDAIPGEGAAEWAAFVDMLGTYNVSTAGLVPMQESVDQIKAALNLIAGSGTQVDIVGHSQGGVAARAAIRQMKTDGIPSNDNVVQRLVTLGSFHYAAPVEQETETEPDIDLGGLLGEILEEEVEDVITHCRDVGWLPVCPDAYRLHSDYPLDWRIPNPDDPNDTTPPYAPWTDLYPTTYFRDLNQLGGTGPTPGPTSYFSLHSVNYPGTTSSEDARLAEPALSGRPSGSPHVQNWTPQNICETSTRPYPVSHSSEWGNEGMRSLMGYALGFKPLTEPAVC